MRNRGKLAYAAANRVPTVYQTHGFRQGRDGARAGRRPEPYR
jgi:hypothetical protein